MKIGRLAAATAMPRGEDARMHSNGNYELGVSKNSVIYSLLSAFFGFPEKVCKRDVEVYDVYKKKGYGKLNFLRKI